MFREALHLIISAILYRPNTPEETRIELAKWEDSAAGRHCRAVDEQPHIDPQATR